MRDFLMGFGSVLFLLYLGAAVPLLGFILFGLLSVLLFVAACCVGLSLGNNVAEVSEAARKYNREH